MSRGGWISVALLASLVAGTFADRRPDREPLRVGDYQVLTGDFHLHSGLGSGGTLTPWGLVTEAQRQGLDVIALTGHNETWDGRVARAFARVANGPIVLVGEEVTSRTQDLVAIGIGTTISPALSLRDQIEEVHRQGGLAIAAHPIAQFQASYRAGGVAGLLDGTEVCHPVIYERAGAAEQLAQFAGSVTATPIGSSDFHASGRVGACRTFLFVSRAGERGVLEALRQHRTVVYGLNGRAFGDPALVQLAEKAGLPDIAQRYTRSRGGVFDWISRVAAAAGLLGIAFSMRRRTSRPAAARHEFDQSARSRFP